MQNRKINIGQKYLRDDMVSFASRNLVCRRGTRVVYVDVVLCAGGGIHRHRAWGYRRQKPASTRRDIAVLEVPLSSSPRFAGQEAPRRIFSIRSE